jgi:surfeit locus 1 family protein
VTRAIVLAGITFASAIVLAVLAFWQLSEVRDKDRIRQSVSRQENLATLNIGDHQLDAEADRFRLAQISGEYIAATSLFLANRSSGGRAGFHLLTAFRMTVEGVGDKVVLVNRGWLPADATEFGLPEFETPRGELRIAGRLNLPLPKSPFFSGDDVVATGMVWQFLDIEQVSTWMGEPLEPLVLELDPSQEGVGGYLRKLSTFDHAWVSLHKRYAIQWFLLAGAFLCVCLTFTLKKRLGTGD